MIDRVGFAFRRFASHTSALASVLSIMSVMSAMAFAGCEAAPRYSSLDETSSIPAGHGHSVGQRQGEGPGLGSRHKMAEDYERFK